MPLLIRDAEIPTSVRVLVMEYFQKSFNLIKKLGQKQINFYRPISLLIKVYIERLNMCVLSLWSIQFT